MPYRLVYISQSHEGIVQVTLAYVKLAKEKPTATMAIIGHPTPTPTLAPESPAKACYPS